MFKTGFFLSSDADDFDVEQGFAGDGEGDQWKGEDEELDLSVSGVSWCVWGAPGSEGSVS